VPSTNDFDDMVIPKWADVNMLKSSNFMISIHQVVFFDEMHKKQIIGMASLAYDRLQVRFLREKSKKLLSESDKARSTSNSLKLLPSLFASNSNKSEDFDDVQDWPSDDEDVVEDEDSCYVYGEASEPIAKFPKEGRMCLCVASKTKLKVALSSGSCL